MNLVGSRDMKLFVFGLMAAEVLVDILFFDDQQIVNHLIINFDVTELNLKLHFFLGVSGRSFNEVDLLEQVLHGVNENS